MILWTLSIGASVALLILTAALRVEGVLYAYLHMAICAAMSAVFIAAALTTARSDAQRGIAPQEISAGLARHMGFVWAWGALALAATYATGIVSWKEWPGFLAVFVCLAGVSLFLSNRLSDGEDSSWFTVGRYLAGVQFVGMVIVMAGLLIESKMTRFLKDQGFGWQDWAANNYFFFGALALAVISFYGLRYVSAEPKTA